MTAHITQNIVPFVVICCLLIVIIGIFREKHEKNVLIGNRKLQYNHNNMALQTTSTNHLRPQSFQQKQSAIAIASSVNHHHMVHKQPPPQLASNVIHHPHQPPTRASSIDDAHSHNSTAHVHIESVRFEKNISDWNDSNHDPIYEIYSEEFKNIARNTLKVLHDKCVHSHFYDSARHHYPSEFIFPNDAESHFRHLQEVVRPFVKKHPYHSYSGYSGPWVENIWIEYFGNKPLTYFRGLFPIFLNWVDSDIGKDMPHMIAALRPVIRKDCLYITVAQSDRGLHEAAAAFPNILTFSAGGYGHIPIPLIKGELSLSPLPSSYEYDLAFYGTDRPERHELLARTKEEAERSGLSFHIGFGTDWVESMARAKITIAPRGFGRTSFRFPESVQMGRLPIYLYDDICWFPYEGTNKSIETFGFMAKVGDIPQVIKHIANMSESEYQQRVKHMLDIREDYTYHGVMLQIAKFIYDPLGQNGGDLRCHAHPRNLVCCG